MDKKKVVVHIYNGILLSHKKIEILTIYDSIDGSRGYYAKWNPSDWEREIPYDLTYIWNLKSRISKQNRSRLIDTENRIMVARGMGDWVEKVNRLRATNW